jgi:hypothetical protein
MDFLGQEKTPTTPHTKTKKKRRKYRKEKEKVLQSRLERAQE